MSVIVPKIEADLPISPLVLSPSLWLDAGALSLADGADVSSWVDSSGNGRSLDTSVGTQTFVKYALNRRPAVKFGNDGYLYAASSAVQMDDLLDGSGRGVVFVVALVDADQSGYDALWSQANGNRLQAVQGTTGYGYCRAYDGTQDNAVGSEDVRGAWHIFCWNYDGSNVENYVDDQDSADVDGQTASGTQSGLASDLRVGGNGTDHLKGKIAEMIVIPGAVSETNRRRLTKYLVKKYRIETDTTTTPAAEWTDLSADVVSGIPCDWGIHGDNPRERVAGPGAMTFDLDNSKGNSAGVRGYYTPGHPSGLVGFGINLPVRLSLMHDLYGTKVRWLGKVKSARARPGAGDPRTSVQCVDWMEAAVKAKLRGLSVQTDVQSDVLVKTIVEAMDEQPPNGKIVSSGSDIYPFALDTAQDENSRVLAELEKTVMSEFGYAYVDAGVLYVEGRRNRAGAGTVRFALDETNLTGLTLTHGLDEILNRIQVSIHPRRVDSAATTVLFNLGSAIEIPRNTEVTINCPYRDPNQQAQRVGGVGMVTPVPNTDYEFNTLKSGAGTDITAQLTVIVGKSKGGTASTPVFGGNSAEVTIQNNGPLDGFIPADGLQLRGMGVYDFEPVVSDIRDDFSVAEYGENAFSYDMPYQSSPANASETAQFILSLYKGERTRARTATFLANWSDENVEQAFNLMIGDRVSITLAELGFDERKFFVNGFRLRVQPSGLTAVTLDLAPVDTTQFWLLEVPGRTELDETTILGYGLFVAGWVLGTSRLGGGTYNETFLN